MSKNTLKKAFSLLDKEQLTEVILDLYEARKEAREWLEFWLTPDSRKACDKAKGVVTKAFFSAADRPKKRPSLTTVNKTIRDFSTLGIPDEEMAEFLVHVAATEIDWLETRYRRLTYRTSLRKSLDTAALFCENHLPATARFLPILQQLRQRASALYHYGF